MGVISKSLEDFLNLVNWIRSSNEFRGFINDASAIILEALREGKKVLICGNGGSAADAQHFAGELISKYLKDRRPLPAVALTTDTSILTAIGNDYGFEYLFARQITALGHPGDVLVAISTSGSSANVLRAIEEARSIGLKVVGFTGARGRTMKEICDVCLNVPSELTPRIQEIHLIAYHFICGLIEEEVLKNA